VSEPQAVATEPRVGVVMITRGRCSDVLDSLERLRGLPERPPLVVVDNASGDGTPEEVRRRFPGVRVIELAENAGAAARTIGVRSLDTPYVAFSDDDSWWRPGALSRAVSLMDAHPGIGLLAARVLVGPKEQEDPMCAEMAVSPLEQDPELPGVPVLGFIACGAVVRRQPFLEVGGFHDGWGVGGEERPLAADLASAGYALVYVPEVVAHHHPSPNRDRGARAARVVRNDLLFRWTRLPLGHALASTARALRDGVRSRHVRGGLAGAARGLPWAIRQRRRVSPAVERDLDAMERRRRG
jgi:GT2 family glycosyltransferase